MCKRSYHSLLANDRRRVISADFWFSGKDTSIELVFLQRSELFFKPFLHYFWFWYNLNQCFPVVDAVFKLRLWPIDTAELSTFLLVYISNLVYLFAYAHRYHLAADPVSVWKLQHDVNTSSTIKLWGTLYRYFPITKLYKVYCLPTQYNIWRQTAFLGISICL